MWCNTPHLLHNVAGTDIEALRSYADEDLGNL